MSPVSLQDVISWFLNREPMTHKKLQKMIYYAQAWSYALQGGPLCDISFEAWFHGPVSPQLHSLFEHSSDRLLEAQGNPKDLKPEQIQLLEDVYATYGDQSAEALEALSKSEAPYQMALMMKNQNQPALIEPALMAAFYRSIFDADHEAG